MRAWTVPFLTMVALLTGAGWDSVPTSIGEAAASPTSSCAGTHGVLQPGPAEYLHTQFHMATSWEGYEVSQLVGRISWGVSPSLCFDHSTGTYLSCSKPVLIHCGEGGTSWNTYTAPAALVRATTPAPSTVTVKRRSPWS